jgi:membrane protease YdiL (CAAX protease family)
MFAAGAFSERAKCLSTNCKQRVPAKYSRSWQPSGNKHAADRVLDPVRMPSEPNTLRRPSPLAPFLGYVVAFHFLWAAWPYFGYPKLTAIGERTLLYAVLNLSIRLLVWVAPVFLYLRYVDRVDPVDYLKLRHHVRRGIAVALVLTAINVVGSVARFGLPHPSLQRVTWNSMLGTSFLVGFIEEIPYRGFMLQKFAERVDFWLANLITSLLFLAVHLPGWMALHMLRADTSATIFVFSLVMAIAFRYADSLWAPIVSHSTNDLLSFVLFRR